MVSRDIQQWAQRLRGLQRIAGALPDRHSCRGNRLQNACLADSGFARQQDQMTFDTGRFKPMLQCLQYEVALDESCRLRSSARRESGKFSAHEAVYRDWIQGTDQRRQGVAMTAADSFANSESLVRCLRRFAIGKRRRAGVPRRVHEVLAQWLKRAR